MIAPKSQVVRKESLLDRVAQEVTEHEVVLEELGISRKKRVNSQDEKVQKSQSTNTDGRVDCTGLPESTALSKLARTFPMKQMLKRLLTSGPTGSSKALKKRRVEPSEMSGMKVIKDRPIVEDDLKEVEEKARLAALHGEKEMRKIVTHLMKGICLGDEEERAELKWKKVNLERNVARLKTDMHKEIKQMEALKAIYSEDEVDAIKADSYVEKEDDEEIEDVVIGIVDGLDGVSPQTELKDICFRIKDLEAELAKERDASASLLSSQ
ncbi:hypothetical protein GIB67_013504 [Kingdonia uniflora]|uniref:Uncharacterized protein n=1 Tax=Kingdonia uniflora TaxID=39325 RepID=A0A7J7KUU8_9MAGN|nr:hypothetical protein GIB67_013504 [Kingdonia uniflora]